MSKYACSLYQGNVLIDDNCIIGYDEMMKTYFFQSGEENEIGEPVLWLGVKHKEFLTINELTLKLKKHGYNIKLDEECADFEISNENQSLPKNKSGSVFKKLFPFLQPHKISIFLALKSGNTSLTSKLKRIFG